MARKNALITVALDGSALTFAVGSAGSFTIDTASLNDDIRNRALAHGIVQKVSDAAAMPKSEFKGKSADEIAAMKFNAMKAVADRLTGDDADWSKRSGDGSGPVAGIIYRAFEQWVLDTAKAKKVKTPPTSEAIRAKYDAMDRAGQLALRNVPEIATIMERLRAERGPKANVDTTALLGELGL
jgi:hypothetical protein